MVTAIPMVTTIDFNPSYSSSGFTAVPHYLSSMKRSPLPLFFVVLLCTALSLPSSAQEQNTYARPGRPTMTIYVLGGAGRGGVWQVERDIGFIELLSVLNVATPLREQQDRRTKIILSLYRGQGDQRDLIYTASLKETVEGSEPPPAVADGDVLIVEPITRNRLTVRTVSSIVSAVSGIILLAIPL